MTVGRTGTLRTTGFEWLARHYRTEALREAHSRSE
jgi:hypothetical protein